jgi:hypothetical protein
VKLSESIFLAKTETFITYYDILHLLVFGELQMNTIKKFWAWLTNSSEAKPVQKLPPQLKSRAIKISIIKKKHN